jgi:spermidine/putrescine transport system substrate-binding protein
MNSGRVLSRRQLLKAAASAGVASVTVTGLARGARAGDGLLVMDWTGYEIPELHQAYIDKYGASPDFSVFADLEEAYSKISAGFQPDIMHSDHWQVPSRRDAGMFQEWDTSRLANFGNLMPQLVNLETLQKDGKQYGLPCDWGINSICYRTDLIELEEETWNSLWDPKFSGKIATTTQMNDAVSAAALALGIANPFVEDAEVRRTIEAKLEEQRPLLRFYWSDPTQLTQAMASGEVAIAFAWPAVYKDLKKQGVPVKYMRPKEGVQAWAQGLLLMKNRTGDDQKAYDFADAWLDPRTGKWLMENYGYGHANSKSAAMVSEEVKMDLQLEDPVKTLESSFFIKDMPTKVYRDYVGLYERVKSGG